MFVYNFELVYVRWKSGVTFVRRCFRNAYTRTCSNIKLNAIKLVLLKLIKLRQLQNTNTLHTVLKNLNSASKQKPTYKVTHDINKSRENMLCERFFLLLFCLFVCFFVVVVLFALGTTAV